MAVDGTAISTSASGRKSSIKDPGATLDYSFDWTDWLAELGDSIATVSFSIDNRGATTPLVEVSHFHFAGVVTVFVTGGELGATHDLTCRIVTNNSPQRIDERTLSIKIRER